MEIAIVGRGRMGRMISECALERGIAVRGIFSPENIGELAEAPRTDAIIDFSAPGALPAIERCVKRTGTPLVCGTTGYSADEAARIRALGAFAPVVLSANYSIGVAVLKRLCAIAAPLLAHTGCQRGLFVWKTRKTTTSISWKPWCRTPKWARTRWNRSCL